MVRNAIERDTWTLTPSVSHRLLLIFQILLDAFNIPALFDCMFIKFAISPLVTVVNMTGVKEEIKSDFNAGVNSYFSSANQTLISEL